MSWQSEIILLRERITMLNLSDFFGPLNISNLLIFFSFVACCEIIGYRPAKLFIGKIPYFLRGAIWLLGMGIVVFASLFCTVFFSNNIICFNRFVSSHSEILYRRKRPKEFIRFS